MDRATGKILDGFGRPGHLAGEFSGVHTLAVDPKNNFHAAGGGGGRRIQKFVKVNE